MGQRYEARAMRALDRALAAIPDDPFAPSAPKVRADCVNGPRPCPWVRCRYHMLVEAIPDLLDETKRVDAGRAASVLERMEHSCALDMARRGGMQLEEMGVMFDLTRERVRQIAAEAARKAKRHARLLGVLFDLPVIDPYHPTTWDLFPPAPDDADPAVAIARKARLRLSNIDYKRRHPEKVREWEERGQERVRVARAATMKARRPA